PPPPPRPFDIVRDGLHIVTVIGRGSPGDQTFPVVCVTSDRQAYDYATGLFLKGLRKKGDEFQLIALCLFGSI
ncbi:hypothetical protein, partial [Rurimicrobium arvi]|uniref:hypothetical protein n=1 Tax=Rurimicrobium arvi TaxID=2049916 RepID=UPI0031DB1A74